MKPVPDEQRSRVTRRSKSVGHEDENSADEIKFSKGVSKTVQNGKVVHNGQAQLSTEKKRAATKMKRKKVLFNKLKRVHEEKPSLFSSQSGFDNYRGIMNLCLLLMVLANFRVALDNVLRYGVLVNPKIIFVFLEDPYSWPSATLVVGSNLFIQLCFGIEKQLSKKTISEKVGLFLHVMNLVVMLFAPIYIVWVYKPPPWFLTVAASWYTVLCLKIVSYIHVNMWCREEKIVQRAKDPDLKPDGPVYYPANLTQRDLYYFLVAPTVCYELNFPRTKKIRKRFLIRRAVEAVFLSGLILALSQQWIVPLVQNSLKPFQEMDFGRFMERLMKLAIPNHLLWLMGFYCLFHSTLNVVAELIYFGDRTFYKDWWNAPNVQTFWSNWNIPIHRWAKRHVYEPMLRNGFTSLQASLSVFFISAFFHEFIVSVPLRTIKPWAFLSMLVQVPFIFITSFMKNPWGNICMWLSLIIGQPLAIMMYYHDYLITHDLKAATG